jgi:hypothetical protein
MAGNLDYMAGNALARHRWCTGWWPTAPISFYALEDMRAEAEGVLLAGPIVCKLELFSWGCISDHRGICSVRKVNRAVMCTWRMSQRRRWAPGRRKAATSRRRRQDEEMERENERGVAKRPDPNELDMPEWAELVLDEIEWRSLLQRIALQRWRQRARQSAATRAWGSIWSAEIFAEGTAHTTTKWYVHRAGLARYRQGVSECPVYEERRCA